VGLEAALSGLPDWRFERAAEVARHARERLAERVHVVTEPGHAGLISWLVDRDASELAARAWEQGVVIRDLPGLNWLRASCGYWTSDEDVERLIGALDGASG
jgi:L-cysteine/cystine lyase